MPAKVRTLLDDARYRGFVERYAFDLPRFAIEVCGLSAPTWHQLDLFESVQEGGSRTSVSSGHGTGKTSGFAIIALWHLLCYYLSNTFLTAPKLKTVHDGVWKEFADLSEKIRNGPHGWIRPYFEIESEKVYVKGFKLNWFVLAKTAPRGSPENLAGTHRDWLLWLVDEASGVPDANFGVITGSLTDSRNRMALASQPTRSAGFFFDTHHKLAAHEGGAWNAMVFNSEESPIVSPEFIADKRAQYTAEEYAIKVQGRFPENSSKYLLGPEAIRRCIGRTVITPDDEWGWMLPLDIGGGGFRDESVMLAMQVTGTGEWGDNPRRVQLKKMLIHSSAVDPAQLHGHVVTQAALHDNSTPLLDYGGMGAVVCRQLDLDGFSNYIRVKWGIPNFSKDYKERYVNQRAQAMCGIARAVETGRFGIDADIDPGFLKKLVLQGSRIPYFYDERARRQIMKKEDMKKEGISSPDIWDSCSFPFLEDAYYSVSGDSVRAPVGKAENLTSTRERMLAKLREQQAAARSAS
jgi:hypothetical protein